MTDEMPKRDLTVEGVDSEAASVAKSAADAAGMSVSDWLSTVILQSTRPAQSDGEPDEAAAETLTSAVAGDEDQQESDETIATGDAGADADTDDDPPQLDNAKENLEQFLQTVIDEAPQGSVAADAEYTEEPRAWSAETAEPLDSRDTEVEIKRGTLFTPPGAIVFETGRTQANDIARLVPRPERAKDPFTPPEEAETIAPDLELEAASIAPMSGLTASPAASSAKASHIHESSLFDMPPPDTDADTGAPVEAMDTSPSETESSDDIPVWFASTDEAPPDAVDAAPLQPREAAAEPASQDGNETPVGPSAEPEPEVVVIDVTPSDQSTAETPDDPVPDPLAEQATPIASPTNSTGPSGADEAPVTDTAPASQEAESFGVVDLQLGGTAFGTDGRDADKTGTQEPASGGAHAAEPSQMDTATTPAAPEQAGAADEDPTWWELLEAQRESGTAIDPQPAPEPKPAKSEQTWWERLEAQRTAEPTEAKSDASTDSTIDPANLEVVRAIVTGEEGVEPERRSVSRWMVVALFLAAILVTALAWRYPDEVTVLRQRIAALIAGDAAPPARTERTLPAPGKLEAPSSQVERLPLDGAPKPARTEAERVTQDPSSQPPANLERPRPTPPNQAVARYLDAARTGDAGAQTALARLYADGKEVAQDYQEAARWYRLAAASGVTDAQYELGRIYEDGRGVAPDAIEANIWYELAARQNHAQAEYRLGLANLRGRGTPINFVRGRELMERAGRQGVPEAKYELGVIYREGLGVPKDNVAAFKWLSEAGELGHKPAVKALSALVPQMSGKELFAAKDRMQGQNAGAAATDEAPAAPTQKAVEPIAPVQKQDPPVLAAPAVPTPLLPGEVEEDGVIIGPPMPDSQSKGLSPEEASADVGGESDLASKSKTIVVTDRQLVAEIQTLLRRLNLPTGNTEGRLDPQTRKAIANYQRIAGLKADGYPTPGLRDHLRSVLAGAGSN
ncbi:MAG: peptidoglycan-binding protein [Alphaproteobacteria bacterium]|nr:peptidoglycan-binding protein [Alphaproteobacteria bacterium]